MARFEVILQSQPEKYYRKVDQTAKSLETCFKHLEQNPFFQIGKTKKLKGYDDLYRYEVKDLRVVYTIDSTAKKVGIVAILPRGDVYKRI